MQLTDFHKETLKSIVFTILEDFMIIPILLD